MTKLMTATIEEKVPADKMREIERRHNFSFTYQGHKCTCGIEGGRIKVNVPEEAESDLMMLARGLEEVVRHVKRMTQAEVSEFLYKMSKMKYRFLREVRKNTIFEVIDEKPLNLENMSLEERCMLEVCEEQSERARENGSEVVTITKEMVDAKIKLKNSGAKG